MRANWLTETYRRIKESRDERLTRALNLLSKKAAGDPEIAEVLDLLRLWAPEQGQDDEKNDQ